MPTKHIYLTDEAMELLKVISGELQVSDSATIALALRVLRESRRG